MKHKITEKDLQNLSKEQAIEIFEQGEEAVIWALLKLSIMSRGGKIKNDESSKPSSQIPTYEKATAKKSKKRGRKKGHAGVRRKKPIKIDHQKVHTLEKCPECGAQVYDSHQDRSRIIEDLEKTTTVTTEHIIQAHYCPNCKKRVEPKIVEALPKSTIGNNALLLSSWMHYGLGQTISQVASVLDVAFYFSVSEGGLCLSWKRIGKIFTPWYEEIAREARISAVLQADETGWRVEGKTHWLWCFTNPSLTYYTINPSRSSSVVNEFLKEYFQGTLVSDFFGAYNLIVCENKQKCLVHLLREMDKVSKRNLSDEWVAYNKKLKRIIRDAIRLSRRIDREVSDYESKKSCIIKRMKVFITILHEDPDCKRLTKRLNRHQEEIFRFLDDPDVPFDNNRAEREIRPAVIARKNSFQNSSKEGADTQSLMMSVYRTLKLRDHNPIETMNDALTIYLSTGELPALPEMPDG